MPFTGEMRPYTRENIRAFGPYQAGVYGIFRDGTAIFIGTSGDIRTRMTTHFAGDVRCIANGNPNLWTAELLSVQAAMQARQRELIEEYKPLCT